MRATLIAIAISICASAAANAAPTELPEEMFGYWGPAEAWAGFDAKKWPGAFVRLTEPHYEWEVSAKQWIMWDGLCKIHDIKQLGELDYEVWATCGLIKSSGGPPYTEMETDPPYNEDITEDHYQFSLCGAILTIHDLKDRSPESRQCAVS